MIINPVGKKINPKVGIKSNKLKQHNQYFY